MSDTQRQPGTLPSHLLRRKDVLAGLLFMAVAAFGLWASNDYPIGTATKMGTGYVPRLLCWLLLGLGVLVVLQGMRTAALLERGPPVWRALTFVSLALVAFAHLIGPFGVVAATVVLVAIGSLASRDSRPVEVAVAAVLLAFLTVAIFVWGVGLPIPVWPEW